MGTEYISEDGTAHEVSSMSTPHLQNAMARLEKTGDTEAAVYAELVAELSTRKTRDGEAQTTGPAYNGNAETSELQASPEGAARTHQSISKFP